MMLHAAHLDASSRLAGLPCRHKQGQGVEGKQACSGGRAAEVDAWVGGWEAAVLERTPDASAVAAMAALLGSRSDGVARAPSGTHPLLGLGTRCAGFGEGFQTPCGHTTRARVAHFGAAFPARSCEQFASMGVPRARHL